MSMLAEPRYKKKISVNPNGLAFTNDESNIGQKLLSKMGWEKGTGLGMDKQGNTEPVKVKKNMENRGFGCSKKEADAWIAHQDDFNSLLAGLNQEDGQQQSNINDEPAKVSSLEERSKASKARVHYMKFTKGKDLSRHSEKDLAMIFGQRSGQNTPTVASTNASDEDGETSDPFLSDARTVTSTMSLQEYFASKMASRNSSTASLQERVVTTPSPVTVSTVDEPKEGKASFFIGDVSDEDSTSAKDHIVIIKKKKKKKDKMKSKHGRGGKVKPPTPPGLHDVSEEDETQPEGQITPSVTERTQRNLPGQEIDEDEPVKKKKKKDKSENSSPVEERVDEPNDEAVQQTKPKKTKKSKRDRQTSEEQEEEEIKQKKSQKKKKKDLSDNEAGEDEDTEDVKVKKKFKRKCKPQHREQEGS